MPKYQIGKDYNVQENTEHGHAVTWREYISIIDSKGYITDFEAEAICKRHENPRYFAYVVENEWLVPKT
jgi:hypothetical protein